MEYHISEPMSKISPSAIREILKYSSDPEVVPFSAGNPAPEAFPVDRIAEISARILREQPITALQYGATEGYTPLREYLQQYLKKEHNKESEDISFNATYGWFHWFKLESTFTT